MVNMYLKKKKIIASAHFFSEVNGIIFKNETTNKNWGKKTHRPKFPAINLNKWIIFAPIWKKYLCCFLIRFGIMWIVSINRSAKCFILISYTSSWTKRKKNDVDFVFESSLWMSITRFYFYFFVFVGYLLIWCVSVYKIV